MSNFPIIVDKSSPIDIKVQIIGQVQLLIALNELCSGAPLPTVVDLAKCLKVNHNTVAAVYKDLTKLGYLTAKKGKGTFVTDNEIIEKSRSKQHIYTLLAEAYDIATQFGLDAAEFGIVAYSQALRSSHTVTTPVEVVFVATKQYEESVYEAVKEEIEVPLSFLSWSEIEAKCDKSLEQLRAAKLIITTPQLSRLVMEKAAKYQNVFGINIKPEFKLWKNVSSLERKTSLLLVAEEKSEGEAMRLSLQNAGICHLNLQVKDIKEWEQDPTILEQAELIIVTQRVKNYVSQQLTEGDRPILVFDFRLDLSNIPLLKARLAKI